MAEDSQDRGARKNGKKPSSGAAGPALFDQPLPANLDAEQGVLGSIIIAPEVCDEVALILRPEDFLDDAHHKLYRTILDMYELGRKIDVTLLVDQLKSSKLFEAVGLFDIVKAEETGHSYVSDRRNKDRTARPRF